MTLKCSLFPQETFVVDQDIHYSSQPPTCFIRFFELPKKKFLLSFIISPYLFSWQSLQGHEFTKKSLAKYSWTRNIGEIYKITETFCASPQSLWAALQHEWILLWVSTQNVLFIQKPHIWPLQLHLAWYLIEAFYFTFIMLLLVVHESIFFLQKVILYLQFM